MHAFVTVGSTRFDALVQAVFTENVLSSLCRKGYMTLVVQCGNSAFELASAIQNGDTHKMSRARVDIEFWTYKPSLQEDYEKADLVISHAGAGTILDVLRMGKSMIVIPNPTLLHNHQEELALALEELGHLKATTVLDLSRTIEEFDSSNIEPFPPFDGSRNLTKPIALEKTLPMPPRTLETVIIEGKPENYEDLNVHAIYDEIAPHFASTRYKPWPIIAKFLDSLCTGWVGLDSGTGNGKYLPLPLDRPGDIWTIGLDRSKNLLDIARTAGTNGIRRDVVWGNVLDNPWRTGIFDYAISIATIHHLATHERRRLAIQRLIQSVSPSHGRVLVYVWAIEQDELSKRKVITDEEPPPLTGKDVVVPWVLSKELGMREKQPSEKDKEPQIFNRYYHMFAKGELSGLVLEAAQESGLRVGPKPESEDKTMKGIEIVQDGWERSNYYVELRLWKTS